eukprot:Lithocolla_globosa_v1_NODE_5841_length_1177_cov_5.512478.p2 type:complete len:177 gc:universal NODE_5841_length_1177_cov_5.512478:605-1135(+)
MVEEDVSKRLYIRLTLLSENLSLQPSCHFARFSNRAPNVKMSLYGTGTGIASFCRKMSLFFRKISYTSLAYVSPQLPSNGHFSRKSDASWQIIQRSQEIIFRELCRERTSRSCEKKRKKISGHLIGQRKWYVVVIGTKASSPKKMKKNIVFFPPFFLMKCCFYFCSYSVHRDFWSG